MVSIIRLSSFISDNHLILSIISIFFLAIARLFPLISALDQNQVVDVVIVGAGMAGLSAAKDLNAAKKSVLVIEARDRMGGRILNAEVSNGSITELAQSLSGPRKIACSRSQPTLASQRSQRALGRR